MEKKSSKLFKIKPCIFCGRTNDDEFMFGKYYHRYTLSVHHNCLFFASGLVQRSRPGKNGILGFLFSDIQNEASRGKKLKCAYCKKAGATVGCIVKACKKVFHFPCGNQYHSLNQYFGNFSSYCEFHKPKQKIEPMKKDFFCYICCTSIPQEELVYCLYSPCCNNNWFHRLCLQQYALSAGRYFFKCPLCNNTTQFVDEMLQLGIHIPIKDAEWELENNAFQELYSRPGCDSSVCKCHKGKDHDGPGGWKLLSCSLCGSRATHKYCRGLNKVKSWMCNDCEVLQAEIKSRKDKTSMTVNGEDRPCINLNNDIPEDYNLLTDSLIYTCDASLIRELLSRRPIVKIMIDKSLLL